MWRGGGTAPSANFRPSDFFHVLAIFYCFFVEICSINSFRKRSLKNSLSVRPSESSYARWGVLLGELVALISHHILHPALPILFESLLFVTRASIFRAAAIIDQQNTNFVGVLAFGLDYENQLFLRSHGRYVALKQRPQYVQKMLDTASHREESHARFCLMTGHGRSEGRKQN